MHEIQKNVGKRVFEQAARGKLPDPATLLSQQEIVSLKRRIFAMKRDTLPPIITHNLVDDANDPVLNHLRGVRLFNHPTDRVFLFYFILFYFILFYFILFYFILFYFIIYLLFLMFSFFSFFVFILYFFIFLFIYLFFIIFFIFLYFIF